MRPPTKSPLRLVVRLNWLLCLVFVGTVLALTGFSSPEPVQDDPIDEACIPQNEADAIAKSDAIDALVFDNCPSQPEMAYFGVDGQDIDNCGYDSHLPCRCLAAAFRAVEACNDSGKDSNMTIMKLLQGGQLGQIVMFPAPASSASSASSPVTTEDGKLATTLLLVLAAVIVGLAFGYGVPSLLRRRSTHR